MSKPVLTAHEKHRRAIARAVARLAVPKNQTIASRQPAKQQPASGVFGSV